MDFRQYRGSAPLTPAFFKGSFLSLNLLLLLYISKKFWEQLCLKITFCRVYLCSLSRSVASLKALIKCCLFHEAVNGCCLSVLYVSTVILCFSYITALTLPWIIQAPNSLSVF